MFTKIYLSRSQSRALAIDHPVGDPTGGAAYREMRDPGTAMGVSAATSLIGAKIGGDAAKSAAQTQADAAREARELQLALAQESIKAQQDILNKQLRAQQGTMDAQLKAQLDALEQQKVAFAQQRASFDKSYAGQMDIAGSTRDQQLGIAQGVLDNQLNTYRPYNEAGLAGQNRLLEYLGIGGSTGSKDYGKYASGEFTPEQFLANQDPGYGFRFSEGQKAVDRQAAARGGLISGNALKATQAFGQEAASQEYGRAFDRYQVSRNATLSPYQGLQGVGFNAATGMVNAYDRFGDRSIGAVGGYGATAGGATGAYGTNMANISSNAANAAGTYGSNVSNIYGARGTQEQQANANYINSLTGALTGYGNAAGNSITSAGNATASGMIGQANAFNTGISGITNAYYQNQMLNLLRDQNKTLPNSGGLGGAP
jgi:hypothetical protein